RKPLHNEVIYLETTRDDVGIELAMQYNDGYNDSVFSFVNNINTHEGGTHLTGFKSALTRVINQYIQKSSLAKKDKETTLTGDDVRDGLTAVLSVKVREPAFGGEGGGVVGKGARAAVRRADQDEARQLRGGERGQIGGQRAPRCVPRGAP